MESQVFGGGSGKCSQWAEPNAAEWAGTAEGVLTLISGLYELLVHLPGTLILLVRRH